MEANNKIDESLFASCGMNCMVCYKHCNSNAKKGCFGCLAEQEYGKPGHCRKCKIKQCIGERGFTYCYECIDFPCKHIRNLEKSYVTRYNNLATTAKSKILIVDKNVVTLC